LCVGFSSGILYVSIQLLHQIGIQKAQVEQIDKILRNACPGAVDSSTVEGIARNALQYSRSRGGLQKIRDQMNRTFSDKAMAEKAADRLHKWVTDEINAHLRGVAVAIPEGSYYGLKPAPDLKELSLFEIDVLVARMNQGEVLVGLGEGSRPTLDLGKGAAADIFTAKTKSDTPVFYFSEVKASVGAGGADIAHAVEQLNHSVDGLLGVRPGSLVGGLYIYIPRGGELGNGPRGELYTIGPGDQLLMNERPCTRTVGNRTIPVRVWRLP